MKRAGLARLGWMVIVVYVWVGIVPSAHACAQTAAAADAVHAHHQDSDGDGTDFGCQCADCECVSYCQSPPTLSVPEPFGVVTGMDALVFAWQSRLHAPPDVDVIHPPPNRPL